MSNFAYLKPAHGLWKETKIKKVQDRILHKISELPEEVRKNKHSMEMLLLVCNCIEHSIDNKKKPDKIKIDKKILLIQIYKELYGNISPADCELYERNIEFLHDNGHIKKESLLKVCCYTVVDWVKRKVLN